VLRQLQALGPRHHPLVAAAACELGKALGAARLGRNTEVGRPLQQMLHAGVAPLLVYIERMYALRGHTQTRAHGMESE
jgi:hypothetical protein